MNENPMKATHAYVGVNKSGSVRAFVMDDPGEEKETGALVASWIEMGRTVQRVDIEMLPALLKATR